MRWFYLLLAVIVAVSLFEIGYSTGFAAGRKDGVTPR